MDNILYRGVSKYKYETDGKVLRPYKIGRFESTISLDEGHSLDEDFTLDSTENNSVVKHQKNSRRYPTSGISTTPIYERAKIYALHNMKYDKGFIFVIDRDLLKKYSIKEYIVSEYTSSPHKPEDEEVIIYSENEDDNQLPEKLIIDVIEVSADEK